MPTKSSSSLEAARAAKPRAMAVFQKIAPVSGIGITRIAEEYALKVNLAEKPAAEIDLPKAIDGVPVKIEVTGTIRAQ